MALAATLASPAPTVRVWAEGGVAKATGLTVTAGPGVQFVTDAAGQSLRFVDADLALTGAPEFTGGRRFTVAVWVRLFPATGARRILTRVNGATGLIVEVNAQGQASVTLSSAKGGYSTTLTGTRIDDGQWHLVTVRASRKVGLLIDSGAIDLVLWVDGVSVRKGWIDPGLFGTRADFSLSTPIVVGRAPGGSAPLVGDVGAVGVWSSTLSDAQVASMWSGRPEAGGSGVSGWGIVVA